MWCVCVCSGCVCGGGVLGSLRGRRGETGMRMRMRRTRSTDVDDVVVALACKTGIAVCREDRADKVSKVGNVVDVGKGRRDQDVPLSILWRLDPAVLLSRHKVYVCSRHALKKRRDVTHCTGLTDSLQ